MSVSDLNNPGVSWGAVLAGAAAAAALSFILLILGVGLGLSSVSPWSFNATAIGVSTIAWLAFMQLAASGIGGYMAGRLRVKWSSIHTDEVHFRDTAHGLLAWAVATLITVAVLAGGTRAVLSGAIDAGSGVAAAIAPAAAAGAGAAGAAGAKQGEGSGANPLDYFSDMLLRAAPAAPATTATATGTLAAPAANASTAEQRVEIGKIFATGLSTGSLAADDRAYLGQVVASRTGLTQAEAEARVDAVYARAAKAAADAKAAAQQAAETARKAGAHTALWMFVALLLGAFVASLAATFGGRQRDHERVLRHVTI
ncbi:membrane protein [Janthinobacterium lividum]|nr:membrane protein [Janthinobacterium lividum]